MMLTCCFRMLSGCILHCHISLSELLGLLLYFLLTRYRRWLSSILTHTLPLSAVYPVWDIILSCPGRERGKHPRLDSLVEICTAMVIAAKPLIFE